MSVRYTSIDWLFLASNSHSVYSLRDFPINKWPSFDHLWKSNYEKVDFASRCRIITGAITGQKQVLVISRTRPKAP